MSSSKGSQARLRQRIAEEAQLLAEEKWIIETLKKIKEHKNCLQIELLHLENIRAQIIAGDKNHTATSADAASAEELQPSTSNAPEAIYSQPSTSTGQTATISAQKISAPKTSLMHDMPVAGIDDDMCNTEELDLAVTNSVFGNQDIGEFDMEEEEDMDNCEIDMNMFMYGK